MRRARHPAGAPGAPLSPRPRGCRLRPSPHGAGMAPKGAGQWCSRGGCRLRAALLSFGRPRFVLPHTSALAPVAWHPWNGARILPGAASVSPADLRDERCWFPPSRAAAWDELCEDGAHVRLLRNARFPIAGETKEVQNQGSSGREGCAPGAAEVRRDAGRSTPRCCEQPSPRPVLVACCRWGPAPGSAVQRRVGSFPSAQQLLKGQGTMLSCGSPGICFVKGVKSSSEPRLL